MRTVSRGCYSCLVWICCFADYTSFSLCPWMQMTKWIFSSRSILRFRRVLANEQRHFAQLLKGQQEMTLSFWEQGLSPTVFGSEDSEFGYDSISGSFLQKFLLEADRVRRVYIVFFPAGLKLADPVIKELCESWWGCLKIRHPHWSTPKGFFLNHHGSSGPQILRQNCRVLYPMSLSFLMGQTGKCHQCFSLPWN